MKHLDPILRAVKPGEFTRIPAGAYYTHGCAHGDPKAPRLKDGVKINLLGSVVHVFPQASQVDAICGEGNNSVSGGTFVIEPTKPGTNAKRNGIILNGPGINRIHNVCVTGLYGLRGASLESFGLMSFNKGSAITDSCIMLPSPGADYISAICGPTGMIHNCKVVWPHIPEGHPAPFWASYNAQCATNLTLISCRSIGGRDAVYSDWKLTRDITVMECSFADCINGLHINAQEMEGQKEDRHVDGVTMQDTVITLNPRAKVCSAVLLDHTWHPYSEAPNGRNRINSVTVKDCAINTSRPDLGNKYLYAANLATRCPDSSAERGIFDVVFEGNDVGEGLRWRNYKGLAKGIKGGGPWVKN